MTELVKRTISGAIFVLVIISASYFGKYSFFGVFLALMVASMAEFYKFVLKMKSQPQSLLGVVIGVALFCWSYFYAQGKIELFTFFVFIGLGSSIFIIELFRSQPKPIHSIAFTILGIIYIAIPFSLLNFIVIDGDSYSSHYLLGMLFLVWGNDTGAYLLGVSIGRHKMFPRISPKKSWEGFAGGVIFTCLIAYILSCFYTGMPFKYWLMFGAITCVFAVFGDLVESMFKRAVGLKDSGKFLPGHGGVLDRFDALIMVIPFAYVFLKMMMLV